ncbi:hypothetical protein [Rhodanobacter sp. B05]|uniref:hypothetical protein n=1 Tax=Rhodanobacter sp. B05 TaxID=1945859 RepID=UPI0011155012|nr:hypothetical protein [Rhodanobacter sp. B05]
MPALDVETLNGVIDSMIKKINSGQMSWDRINTATFIHRSENGHIILQIVPVMTRVAGGATARVNNYLFQAKDNGGETQLQVNSGELPSAKPVLEKLFDAINSGVTKKGLDFLKSIIDN